MVLGCDVRVKGYYDGLHFADVEGSCSCSSLETSLSAWVYVCVCVSE